MHFSVATKARIVSAAIAIGAACSSPPAAAPGSSGSPPDASRSASLGDTVPIELGRSASLDGGRLVLTFVSHGTDSRCPANVVCVWMGDVAVRIAARSGKTSAEVELHTGIEPHSLSVNGYMVRVVGLTPYPGTKAAEAPRATPTVLLRVTK